MKILYIGHYRDNDGWGRYSLNNINVLIEACKILDAELVISPIRYHDNLVDLPPHIQKLEKGSQMGADFIIQNTLPQNFVYSGPATNVGWYLCETNSLEMTEWVRHINLMDFNIVSCESNKNASIKGGVNKPLYEIPCSIDENIFYRSYIPLLENPNKAFRFYTIAECTRRKNLGRFIMAFYLEFGVNENVELIIKTNINGKTPQESRQILIEKSNEIKRDLNLGKYKDIIFITERLTDSQLYGLHQHSDCFVSTSYGEGWGYPAFEALGFGKTPIVPDCGAFPSYISDDNGWLCKTIEEPVLGMQNVHGDLYYGGQTWNLIDMGDLRKSMREAFENREIRERKSRNGIHAISNFNYENVGRKLENILKGN